MALRVLAAPGVERVRRGRFELARDGERLTLDAVGADPGVVWRSARWGSLGLLVLVPAGIALLAPARSLLSSVALVVLPILVAGTYLVHMMRYRLLELGPWSRVRGQLIVEAGSAGDYRDAPQGATVLVDGSRRDADGLPEVSLTRSVWIQPAGGAAATLQALYRVNLVFPDRVVRVETFRKAEDAAALANDLDEALGGDGALRTDLEVPFEATPAGVVICVLAGLTSVFCAFGLKRWVMEADFANGLATRLAIAGCVAAANAVALQALALRFAMPRMAADAQRTFRIAYEPRSRRGEWAWALAWAALAAAFVAVARSPLHEGSFDPMGDRLRVVDVGATAAVLGKLEDKHGARLVATDTKTGALLWALRIPSRANRVAVDGPVGVAYGGDIWDGSAVVAFDLGTGTLLWRKTMPGALDGALFKQGCILLRDMRNRGFPELAMTPPFVALQEHTGERCAAFASLDEPAIDPLPSDPGERLTVLRDRIHHLGDRSDLAREIEGERAKTTHDPATRRASVKVDGISYEVDATGPRLVVMATRGDATVWRSELGVEDIDGLPLAAGDGLVIVVGSEHRGKEPSRLRLVGMDAATGTVRFVVKHPHPELGPSDVVVAKGTAVLLWAREVIGYDPLTGARRWSVSGADDQGISTAN